MAWVSGPWVVGGGLGLFEDKKKRYILAPSVLGPIAIARSRIIFPEHLS